MAIHLPPYRIPPGPISRPTADFLNRLIGELNRGLNWTSSPNIQMIDYGSGMHLKTDDYPEVPIVPVRAATVSPLPTYNATPSRIEGNAYAALGDVDGISLNPGDKVLVKNEDGDDEGNNGVWIFEQDGSSGPDQRRWAFNRDGDTNLVGGMLVSIVEGTNNACSVYKLLSTDPIVPGTGPQRYAALPQIQPVRVYDTVPVSGRYPAYLQDYNPDTNTWTDTTPVYAVGVNDEPLDKQRYLGRRMEYAQSPADRMVYAVQGEDEAECCASLDFKVTSLRPAGSSDSTYTLTTVPVPIRSAVTYEGTINGMTWNGSPIQYTVSINAYNTVDLGMFAEMNVLNLINPNGESIALDVVAGTDSFDIVAQNLNDCQAVNWSACLEGNTCCKGGPVPDTGCGPIPASLLAHVVICSNLIDGHAVCEEQDLDLCVTYNESTEQWEGSGTFTLTDCDTVDFAYDFALTLASDGSTYTLTSTLFDGTATICPVDGDPFEYNCEVTTAGCDSTPCVMDATVTICVNELDGHEMDQSQTFTLCMTYDADVDKWLGSGTFTLTDSDTMDFPYDFSAVYYYSGGTYYLETTQGTFTLTDCPVDGEAFSTVTTIAVAGYGDVPSVLRGTWEFDGEVSCGVAFDPFCMTYNPDVSFGSSVGSWASVAISMIGHDCENADLQPCSETSIPEIFLYFDPDDMLWHSTVAGFDEGTGAAIPIDVNTLASVGSLYCGKSHELVSSHRTAADEPCTFPVGCDYFSLALTTPSNCDFPLSPCNNDHYEIYLTTP